jgi:hypothetical protein
VAPPGADVDTVDAPWTYVDAVHGEPQGPTAGALLLGVLALFVCEEVGADERGILATEDGLVRGGAAAGYDGGGRYGDGPRSSLGAVPVAVAPGGGPQQSQQWLDEASDKVQHVLNSTVVEGHAPGPSQAVAGVLAFGRDHSAHVQEVTARTPSAGTVERRWDREHRERRR